LSILRNLKVWRRSNLNENIYRAVSDAELNDIANFGLRCKPGGYGYETVKLFALEHNDADSFGKLNQNYDNLPFSVIKIAIPGKVFSEAFQFEADGMQAISIEEKCLNLLTIIY